MVWEEISSATTANPRLCSQARVVSMEAFRDRLTDREKQIVIYRYGLYGNRPRTQRELAAEYGISRSYVSRIEKKALCKLREVLIERKLI